VCSLRIFRNCFFAPDFPLFFPLWIFRYFFRSGFSAIVFRSGFPAIFSAQDFPELFFAQDFPQLFFSLRISRNCFFRFVHEQNLIYFGSLRKTLLDFAFFVNIALFAMVRYVKRCLILLFS